MKAMPSHLKLVAFALAIFLAAMPEARAGRRAFINLWDTETLKRGEVELEEWLWWREDGAATAGWIWFAPVFGLTEQVELAFPFEAIAKQTQTAITDFTAEARIRLGDPQDDSAGLHQMVRVFYQQNLNHPYNLGRFGIPWLGGNFVSSLGPVGGSHATLDVGAYSDFRFQTSSSLSIQTLGAGYTHSFTKEMRAGLEYSHEIGLSETYKNFRRYYLGPNFSFSRGNVWMTFGLLKGLTDNMPDFLGRLALAVAL
jgi:hypothetical protein